jgi:hypothetical protein
LYVKDKIPEKTTKLYTHGGSMDSIASEIKTIDNQAEIILEAARKRANEVLIKGKDQANQILSSRMPVEKTDVEYNEIISKATLQAQEKTEDSKKQVLQIMTNSDGKADQIAGRVISIVRGV